ncbi:MAG: MoxR family ATPase [Deltaproteobacteria bacterium]|nr:MoxR family ATPase [Deltaproteobacteria bacterium]
MDCSEAYEKIEKLKNNLNLVIRGKEEVIELAVAALLSRGHLLIEDVPGVGKTTLAHALAKSINCEFQRIQFTSDLLPSDVIGVTVYNQAAHSFEFRPGPIFANIVLADEINRTTPKTQSALLEAMNDRQVSVDKVTYRLPEPFMLLATQNPLEYAGTFPLPESQLDRFTMCIRIGYPGEADEREILRSVSSETVIAGLKPVITADDLAAMQTLVEGVRIEDNLVGYILAIAAGTRAHKGMRLGVSPRAAKTLYRAAQARAMILMRDYCLPDDIKTLAVPVFAHRIIPADGGFNDDIGGDKGNSLAVTLIEDVLSNVAVPV